LRHKQKDGPFWDFGIPTAESIQEVRQVFSGPVIASGGVRSGLDCVKAISLGASLCGMALPVLKAQAKGGSLGVKKFLDKTIEEIRTAMFLIGVKTVDQIKS
jgi:isopentenyl-diphosphate delta-isomerase